MTTYNSGRGSRKKPEPSPTIETILLGLPPQALELEEAVLGAIMLERDKLAEVLEILPNDECFYVPSHQKIYAAIRRLSAKGDPVDLLTVTEELRKSSDLELVGGAYYLTRLTMGVVSSANAETHARIVMEKYMLRELIQISNTVRSEAYESGTDVFDLLDSAQSQLFGLSGQQIKRPYQSAPELARQVVANYIDRESHPTEVTGITTGYRPLDRVTNGFNKGDQIIIAARPSVGKTAFALNLALNAMKAGHGVGFFSLEMSAKDVMNRLLSCLAQVQLEDIKLGRLIGDDHAAFFDAASAFEKMNFKLDETGALTLAELRTKARRMVEKEGVNMIIIDYLQLMQGDSKANNREQEISKISREIKALAKNLGVPIIALSQLNRASETRASDKPMLSDLRESGSLEQDADMVIFLTRASYQKSEDEIDPSVRDHATIHVAKNRNGSTNALAMFMVKDIQAWFDDDGYRKYSDRNNNQSFF